MKTLLIDADGVLLKKQPYFSKRISMEYNVPYEHMEPFYTGELRKCQIGLADMKAEIARYLPQWNWSRSVDEFLQYWFTTDAIVDESVLQEVRKLREKGVACYLASDQEKYRGAYIWNTLGLKNDLDGSFFSFEVGASKSTPEYFQNVLSTLHLQPEEVAFWDDDQKNVDTAASVGIDANFYRTLEDFKASVLVL